MKHTWAIGIGFLLLFFNASLVLANGISDPRIGVGGDSNNEYYPSFQVYFNSNPIGGGYSTHVNTTGVDWTSFEITVPTPYYEDSFGQWYLCKNDANCTYSVNADNLFYSYSLTVTDDLVTILFYGVGYHNGFWYSGIPNDPPDPPYGSHFYINLNDDGSTNPDGTGGWLGQSGGGLSFTGTGNPTVPEPATSVLLLGGLTVLVLCFCWRKRELAP